MIGAEVTELIQGYTTAKTGELTEAELMETVFPHPTISETMHESVLAGIRPGDPHLMRLAALLVPVAAPAQEG